MKLRKIAAVAVSAVMAVSALTASAFADYDLTAAAEANKGLAFEGIAGWAAGLWVCGNDDVESGTIDPKITVADLKTYDSIEITYTSDETPPALSGDGAMLTFCYKFVTGTYTDDKGAEAEKMEAYLPSGWVEYGPKDEQGNTYPSVDYFNFPVETTGTITIPTADIIASLNNPSDDWVLRQFGIGCNTYDFDTDWTDEADLGDHYMVNISSVKLIGAGPAAEVAVEETIAAPAEETAAVEETIAAPAEETAAVEETVAAPEATADDKNSNEKTNSDTGAESVAIIAGLAVLATGAIVIAKKKK